MEGQRSVPSEHPARRAVYIISVAAELAGVHPQTLRIYEQKGLVRPHRTSGNTRRYSDEDIVRLRRVQALTHGGINLAGVKRIIELEEEIESLRERVRRLHERLEDQAIPMADAQLRMQIVPRASIPEPPAWKGAR
jgi:MerR family transcriptional regulator/heat shock protein HspR